MSGTVITSSPSLLSPSLLSSSRSTSFVGFDSKYLTHFNSICLLLPSVLAFLSMWYLTLLIYSMKCLQWTIHSERYWEPWFLRVSFTLHTNNDNKDTENDDDDKNKSTIKKMTKTTSVTPNFPYVDPLSFPSYQSLKKRSSYSLFYLTSLVPERNLDKDIVVT